MARDLLSRARALRRDSLAQLVEYQVAEKMIEAKTAAMDKLKPAIEKATSSPHYAAAVEKVTTAQVRRVSAE